MFSKTGALSVVVCLLGGCSHEAPPEATVILEVAGRSVTSGELDRFVRSSVSQESQVLSPEVMAALFQQFVEEQILLHAADEAGIAADAEEVSRRMAAVRNPESPPPGPARTDETATAAAVARELRVQKLLEKDVLSSISVGEDEIAARYEAKRNDFNRSETVDVSQILVDSKEKAAELRKALLSKKSTFEDLARENSEGPEAKLGGHLGAFARGELPQSFEAEVFSLKPGTISEVVATDFGFHIFRVNERKPAASLTLEEAKDTIRVDLLRQKSDEAVKDYVEGLRRRYAVKIFRERLGFSVAGANAVKDGDSME